MRILIAALAISFFAGAAQAQIAPTSEPQKETTSPAASSILFKNPAATTDAEQHSASNSYMIKDAPLPGDYVMGKPTAPLIMIEYASLSCPHCAHFSNNTLPDLEKKYIDTGRMRYVLRMFPLNEPALKGAMLLDCVGEQNKSKYFLFAKVLFDAQNKWAFDNNYMSGLETIATVGGLSHEQFEHCVNNTDREMKVLQAKKLANDEIHVPHTPYIFIGGKVYEGDRSPEAMESYIDDQLEHLKR